MGTHEHTMASSFSPAQEAPPLPLRGTLGPLIQRSRDARYEIRSAAVTSIPSSAIVNATTLSMASSTSHTPSSKFALTQAAGPLLIHHIQTHHVRGLRVGEAVATPSFDMLNCAHIVHANVPSYRGRTPATLPLLRQLLVDCYRRCLEEAEKLGARTLAFPCLGAGLVLGWHRREAARIGVNTVRAWFKHPVRGAERRRKIPGPVYFLTGGEGPYEEKLAYAWEAAFE